MKTILTLMVIAVLLACAPIAALDRDMRLRVVSPVHANKYVLVTDQEKRARKTDKCLDDGTRDWDPVCASNGKKYLNMNRFKYNKCLIKVNNNEDITIENLEFCKEAMWEDLESEGGSNENQNATSDL